MRKILLILGAAMLLYIFGITGTASAHGYLLGQEINGQTGDTQTNGTQGVSQTGSTHFGENKQRHRVPKPERNKWNGKTSKKKNKKYRKYKKSLTSSIATKQNRIYTKNQLSGEDKTNLYSNNDNAKEQKIKSEPINNVSSHSKNHKVLKNYENIAIESGWAEGEFKDIKFGDKRIESRFTSVAEKFSTQPQVPINQACDDWADTKATYRLFHNEKVKPDLILSPHQKRTQERMERHPLVLAAQDTTYMNYTKHTKTSGLGSIGTEDQDLRGLLNHTTLVMTPEGLPLGVLSQKIWARDDEDSGSAKERKRRPIEEKESYKWLESLQEISSLKPEGVEVINICDRESDIYEYFQEARKLREKIINRV